MNRFINKLFIRHSQPELNIKPRPIGKFESGGLNSDTLGLEVLENSSENLQDLPIQRRKRKYLQREQYTMQSEDDLSKEKNHPSQQREKDRENLTVNNISLQEDMKLSQPMYEIPVQSVGIGLDQVFPEENKIKPYKDKSAQEKQIHGTRKESSSKPSSSLNIGAGHHLPVVSPISYQPFKGPHQPENNPYGLKAKNTNQAPTIKVSIGRIEVKANVHKPTPVSRKRKKYQPKLTLEDYLNKNK